MAPGGRPTSLSWVEQTLGISARVVSRRRLTGGLTSLVHELTVVRRGRRTRCILRSWPSADTHPDWSVRAVKAEAGVLTALERSDVPAPRLIAFTTEATTGGPRLSL